MQNELTAERLERAIAIQQELMRDMRSDDVDEENRETAEEVAAIVQTVVLPALRAEQERLNPQPLTLDELRGMDGLPVWCVDCFGNQCWAIVNVADDDCIDNETGAWSMGLYGISDKPIDLTGWLAYRTKPEGREKHD
jgi:hypothetical protein